MSDKQKRNYLPAINENYTDNVSHPQLAALGNMSPFHFTRLFKQVTAATPYNYLLQVRPEQATLQLCNTITAGRLPFTFVAKALYHLNMFTDPLINLYAGILYQQLQHY